MNRKGFAISIVMYAMVFLLIALFYILLSVVKARYTVNNNLRESIVQELNESNHGYTITYRRLKKVPTCKSYWVDNMDTPSNYDDDVIYITPSECTSSSNYNSNKNSNIVNFNYVWYSGKLWRIVALYPDKTMKLITEDVIANVYYGQRGADFKNSWIYQWLNEDFLDTLENSNDIVADTVWNYTTDSSDVPSRPESLSNQQTVTAKVGLLTAYELYHSHVHWPNNNYSVSSPIITYLDYHSPNVIDEYWWLLTIYGSGNVRIHLRNGIKEANTTEYIKAIGVKPVIRLKSGVKFTGSGTIDDPYKIVGDKTAPTYNTTLLNTRSSGEYVRFDNEIYRIVEVENGITSLIYDDFMVIPSCAGRASTVYYGKSTNASHYQLSVYGDYYLNNTWYNSISSPYKNMIVDGTFYIKGSNNYKASVCKSGGLNNTTTKECTRYTAEDTDNIFIGKVGLPRMGQMFSSSVILRTSDENMWLISNSGLNTLEYPGIYYSNGSTSFSNADFRYRPIINLKSTVKITGGTGYSDSPFEISE